MSSLEMGKPTFLPPPIFHNIIAEEAVERQYLRLDIIFLKKEKQTNKRETIGFVKKYGITLSLSASAGHI